MSGEIQLHAAKKLLEKGLGNLILDLSMDIEDPRIFIKMRDGFAYTFNITTIINTVIQLFSRTGNWIDLVSIITTIVG
jgi:hypothetical protein